MTRSRAAERAIACVTVFLGLCVADPRTAEAQRVRRRFEPTDLDLTPRGIAEIDVQGGWLSGEDGERIIAPDVEASLGIGSNVELEIDTTYGVDTGQATFLDDTWASLRLGIVDVRSEDAAMPSWAAGIQAGPKLPTSPGSRGLGAEALVIVGGNTDRRHIFLQAGFLLDPVDTSFVGRVVRPFGLEGGVDAAFDLDDVDRWSIKTELGGVRFFSPYKDQLHVTAGPALRVFPWLEVSAIALVGILGGGDHYGALLGVSPQFRAF